MPYLICMVLADTKRGVFVACYHPLIGIPYSVSEETGKIQYNILAYNEDLLQRSWPLGDPKIIPCGRCIGCRIHKSQEWANRLMLEVLDHEENWFVTLTYDDEHIPWNVYNDDGFEKKSFTLKPEDLQSFVKRLRSFEFNHFGIKGIKFYAAGEYGPLHRRPHYHIIFFGLHLDDLIPFGKSDIGDQYYRSPSLENIWKKGYVGVAKVTRESCAYVARYTLKKLGKSETDFYTRFNIVPEFTRMSLNPAIGLRYFERHKEEIYKNDEIYLSTQDRGYRIRPPKYFDKKYDLEYPNQMKAIKEFREDLSKNLKQNKLEVFSGSYLDLLRSEESKLKNKVKNLKRGECKNA